MLFFYFQMEQLVALAAICIIIGLHFTWSTWACMTVLNYNRRILPQAEASKRNTVDMSCNLVDIKYTGSTINKKLGYVEENNFAENESPLIDKNDCRILCQEADKNNATCNYWSFKEKSKRK